MESSKQTLNHPLINNINKHIVTYFIYQLIIELIENTPKEQEKRLNAELNDFMKKHDIKFLFNPKLLRRKLIRIKFGQNRIIIRVFGIYLLKNVDSKSIQKIKMVGKILLNRWRRLGEIMQFSIVNPDQNITFWVVSAQYNSGDATVKCLNFVFNQDLPRNRVRHIYIDDASTDNTPELIEPWLSKHPDHYVEYIRNEKNIEYCSQSLYFL